MMIKIKSLINEENFKYHIYCDMDGVLTDFDLQFNKISPVPVKTGFDFKDKYGGKKFWKLIDSQGIKWWSEMPWMPDGKKLWSYIKKVDPQVEILSSPSKHVGLSGKGKEIWIERELGPEIKLNLVRAEEKMKFAAPTHILIDDLPANISDWRNAGGIGILHKSADKTIMQLQKLGM